MGVWPKFIKIGIILWTISVIEGQNAKSSKAKNQKYYMKEKLVGRFKIVPMGKMALLNGKPPIEISADVIGGNPNPTKSPFHFPNHEEFLRKQMYDYFNHLSNTNNRLQSQGSSSNTARTPKVQKQPPKSSSNLGLGKNQPPQIQHQIPQNGPPLPPYQNTPENGQKLYSNPNPNENNYPVQQQHQQYQYPQSQPQHHPVQQQQQQQFQHYQPQLVQNYQPQGPVYQQPQPQNPAYQQQHYQQQQPNPHQYLNIQKVPLTQVYTQTQNDGQQERGKILNQNQNQSPRESLSPEDIYTYPFPLTEQEMEFIESERDRINRQQQHEQQEQHYDGPPPPHLANVANSNYPVDQGEIVYEPPHPPPRGYYSNNGSPDGPGPVDDSESEGDENQKSMKPYVTIEFEFPAGVDKDQKSHEIEKSQRNVEQTPMKYFINY